MFRQISKKIPKDNDFPARVHRLDCLNRVLDLSLYDVYEHDFDQEEGANHEYIRFSERCPSTRLGLSLNRRVVEDAVSLLFGEQHFPTPHTANMDLKKHLADLIKETSLNSLMIEAAQRGSVGSVVILMRISAGRVIFEAVPTTYLTPIYQTAQPDRLQKIVERYKVSGQTLIDLDYSGIDDTQTYMWRREWTQDSEVYFFPQQMDDFRDPQKSPIPDAGRTVDHRLGFVPALWIKNLPGGNGPDGRCTFDAAIDATIAIDRQLSQLGRALKYQADPMLHISDSSGSGEIMRSAGNALITGKDGDAKLLELTGDASDAVLQYVSHLRTMAVEAVRGDRTEPDKLCPAQSGRAIEIMKLPLINLADDLKVQYGEGALLDLLRMVIMASERIGLQINGKEVGQLSDSPITLEWPEYFASDAEDRQAEAMRLDTLLKAGVISRETAVKSVAKSFDIEDLPAEIARIKADRAAELAEFPEAGRQIKGTV